MRKIASCGFGSVHLLYFLCVVAGAGGCGDTTGNPASDLSRVRDLTMEEDLSAGCAWPCEGDTPICDTATGECVGCLGDRDCPAGQICRGQACAAGCSAQRPCGADAGSCDVDLGICRGCIANGECGGATPICDRPSGRCVACLPSSDTCPMGQYCGPSTGSGSPGGYACLPGCKSAADCAGGDGGGTMMGCCDHACVDLGADARACGACGKACAQGQSCCGGACVDLQASTTHCGGCGQPCAPAHATAKCAAGRCTVGACDRGWGDCDANASNGCEIDTTRDAFHCGSCTTVCMPPQNGQAACVSGACTLGMCATGYGDCDTNPSNGCEAVLATDIANCGRCGNKCSSQNGAAACVAGQCQLSCQAPLADCDADVGNGCEVNLRTDPRNCNGCGNVCNLVLNGTPGCADGLCGIASCNANYADCDKDPVNGCEADLRSDPKNCGACAKACGSGGGQGTCMAGVCTLVCNANTANCDNDASNGCEANLLTDAKNCGGCGKACGGGGSCINGKCQTCNTNILVLGDGEAGGTALATAIGRAGMTADFRAGATTTYTSTPAPTGYGAVVILAGGNYTVDMPSGGQQAIAAANQAGVGVVLSEWAAYQVQNGRWQQLKPLLLIERSSGTTTTLTFTVVPQYAGHPIWTGLPASFSTVNQMGANTGNNVINGGTLIATCTQCTSAGVAIRDGAGRIVQIAHAGTYMGNQVYSNDTNTTLMMTNAIKWAARCF